VRSTSGRPSERETNRVRMLTLRTEDAGSALQDFFLAESLKMSMRNG
jgi:hypothetical protein